MSPEEYVLDAHIGIPALILFYTVLALIAGIGAVGIVLNIYDYLMRSIFKPVDRKRYNVNYEHLFLEPHIDPDGSLVCLLNNTDQYADNSPQEVVLHGRGEPNNPDSSYFSNEGMYRRKVKVENENISEKLGSSVTA